MAEDLPSGVPVTVVHNKIDLTGTPPRADEQVSPPCIYLSARTGAGVDLLRAHLKSCVGYLRRRERRVRGEAAAPRCLTARAGAGG